MAFFYNKTLITLKSYDNGNSKISLKVEWKRKEGHLAQLILVKSSVQTKGRHYYRLQKTTSNSYRKLTGSHVRKKGPVCNPSDWYLLRELSFQKDNFSPKMVQKCQNIAKYSATQKTHKQPFVT